MSTAQTEMVKRQEGQCEYMWGAGGGELVENSLFI